MARLTRPMDEYECRIAGGCPIEDWLINKGYVISEFICEDCPVKPIVNNLAEYEDKYENE